MFKKKGDVQIAQLHVDLVSRYSVPSTDPGKIARNNLEKANIELEKMNRANVFAMNSLYQSYEDGYKLFRHGRGQSKLLQTTPIR